MLHRAERELEVAVSPDAFLDIVWDFARYPEFVTGISAARVTDRGARTRTVEVTARLMGIPLRYELECEREDDRRVKWRRLSGAFAAAEGSWTLVEERDGRSWFRYSNAVDPGVPVPGFIIRYVLETSLPRLLGEFRSRAEGAARARVGEKK